MLLSLFIATLFINKVYSVSVVNNVTVKSEVLSELFFSEVRNNQYLRDFDLRDSRPYDPQKCIDSLREIINQFPNLKVIPFIDAWGKFPSGILSGNIYDIGNYDQCVKTSVILNENLGTTHGQFCFAKVPLKLEQSKIHNLPKILEEQILEERIVSQELSINIGICVPDSCSPQFLSTIFQKSFDTVFNGALSDISVSNCSNGKPPTYTTIIIVGICVFSLFGILMFLSTLYDLFTSYFKKSPVPVLLAFSVLTNGKKLFAINTKRSPNNIDCLTGFRIFSMMWILCGHTFLATRSEVVVANPYDVAEWSKSVTYMFVMGAGLAVDTFFFISGLLVAWLGFRDMDRTKGKLNIVMMYVHRYIRLTPVLAALLLFLFSLNKLIGDGPFRQKIIDKESCSVDNFWPSLLYIQNYYHQVPTCFTRSWYLAVDFQLYILSPLLLIPIWKWGKKVTPLLMVLSLASIASVMTIYMTNGFTSLTGSNKNEWIKTYTPMHTRCTPWLVGFALGYFMHLNRQTTFRISKLTQLLAWIGSIAIFLSIIIGPIFTIRAHGEGTLFEAAMYEGWRHFAWAIGLSWVTFACHHGMGGFVDGFLSHPFWQPLGRLTYTLYLVHSNVLRINFGITRTVLFFSTYEVILKFWSAFGISLLAAICASLAFESPILVLEKFIFGKDKPKKTDALERATPSNIDREISKNV